MHHQPSNRKGWLHRGCPRPLLMLGLWVSLSSLTPLGSLSRVGATELVIEEAAAPVAEPTAPEPPIPSEPAAIAPTEFEPTAPEPITSEPIAPVPSESAGRVTPEWTEPAPALQNPAPPAQASDPYIDPQDYGVGATEPYSPPDQVVVNERSSGCQANLAPGQAIAGSLCAAPSVPSPYAATAQATTEQSPVWSEEPPTWATRGWTGGAEAVGSGSAVVDDSRSVSAEAIQNTLRYRSSALQNLAVKPLTGANPLGWILNGERMIFPLPIPVDITSVFGWRNHPISGDWRFHSGTDLGAPTGTPVLAAYSGHVALADFLGGYGLTVLLSHNQDQQETRYAHLSEIFVRPGQWVRQGTVIGLVGSTGNSTGPHLHFEALQNTPDGMVAVDPTLELQTTLTQLAKALQTARLTAQRPVAPQPITPQPGTPSVTSSSVTPQPEQNAGG